MRFTVYKSSRLAAAGIHRATIEDALDTALPLMRTPGSVRIEDHQTGNIYKDGDILELKKMLDA
ncbi:MAG TPA: hypothetical protein VFW19_03510 [Allosphingosinicella sp.]|nr:hypothetical protein [Allosphingosinicella sp.]